MSDTDSQQAKNAEQQKVIRRIEITIPSGKSPERIDVFLTRQVAELTRSKANQLISDGILKVDGNTVKPSYKVKPGDFIEFEILSRPPLELEPEDIPLDVAYEDKWLLVIDKPADMVVHPAQGNRSGTIVNALLNHYGELARTDDPDRPGIVHRLDKDTTGLLVICKQEPALSKLAQAFRERTVEREYYAIVWWNMQKRKGTIDQPIGRDPRDRKKYAAIPDGKPARTHWQELEQFDFLSLLSFRLETGRTHQIRVHASNAGHPVFGDCDYGGRNRQVGKLSSAQRKEAAEYFDKINRQMLHARTLGFAHPITGEWMKFESNLPDDFKWLLEKLRNIKELREQKIKSIY